MSQQSTPPCTFRKIFVDMINLYAEPRKSVDEIINN
jgi:hypothetical protein